MKRLTEFLKQHSLVIGILLMFLLTWPIDLSNSGMLPIQFPFLVYLFLGWGFVFASIIMTWLTLGREGVITLLKRYLKWRVGWKWYLAGFCLKPVLAILGVYLAAAWKGVPPDYSTIMAYKLFGPAAILPLFVAPFFLIDFVSNGEEIGWRGYVLPRLQKKFNVLTSTLILGVIWGLWHLPKFLSQWNPVAFAWFMVHIMAFAVIMTWLYNGTKGSLLLVTIAHASANTIGIFLPLANTVSSENMGAYIGYVLLEVMVAITIIATGPEWLSRTEPLQVQA
jgi:membrane protease YdiL (CAAX protease family)